MESDQIQWKSSKEHFGRSADVITDFKSDHRAVISRYTGEDVEQILPLVKGDVVYLKRNEEAIPESYKKKLDKCLEPNSVNDVEDER